MPKKTLNDKEKQFCYYIANGQSIKKSAALSGFKSPLITGLKLFGNPKIKEQIDNFKGSKKQLPEVSEGLRAIAFGDISDAVRLATTKDIETLDIGALDLQMVSEIKFAKSGGIEIKFYDRIKALEKLMEVSETDSGNSDFFKALQESAESIVALDETEA